MTTHADILAATLRAQKAVTRLDKAAIDDLVKIYNDAAAEIADRIRAAGGTRDLLEYSNLQSLRSQVEQILQQLTAVRDALLAGNLKQAAGLGAVPFDGVATAQGLETPISAAAMRISQDAVKFVRTFIAKDGLQLSDRLWRIDTAARDTIINSIQRAVVMGQGASEAARELLARGQVVSRDIANKMEGASATRLSNQIKAQLAGDGSPMVNAMRLMRTEINRAHGEAYIMAGADHPDFGGFRYLLSPSHPKPDICDLLSTQNVYGLGAGVYPDRESTPWPAHPNTLSFIQIVFKDQISEADRAGIETQQQALARLNDEQRVGVLGPTKADLFDQGKFRSDHIPEDFRK